MAQSKGGEADSYYSQGNGQYAPAPPMQYPPQAANTGYQGESNPRYQQPPPPNYGQDFQSPGPPPMAGGDGKQTFDQAFKLGMLSQWGMGSCSAVDGAAVRLWFWYWPLRVMGRTAFSQVHWYLKHKHLDASSRCAPLEQSNWSCSEGRADSKITRQTQIQWRLGRNTCRAGPAMIVEYFTYWLSQLILTFLGFAAVSGISLQGYSSNKGLSGGGIYNAGNKFSLNTNTIVLFVFVLAVALVLSWTYFTLARAFTKQFIWITGILNILFGIGTAVYYFVKHYYSAAVVFAIFGIFSIVRTFCILFFLHQTTTLGLPRIALGGECSWHAPKLCLEKELLTPISP